MFSSLFFRQSLCSNVLFVNQDAPIEKTNLNYDSKQFAYHFLTALTNLIFLCPYYVQYAAKVATNFLVACFSTQHDRNSANLLFAFTQLIDVSSREKEDCNCVVIFASFAV
jgi:hypothetical protein